MLALALSMPELETQQAVDLFHDTVNLVEDRLQLTPFLLGDSFQPLLNGSEIQTHVLPKVQGPAFRKVMKAQEEWQIRRGIRSGPSLSTKNNDESQEAKDEHIKAALMNYLVQKFPEYCEC